MKATPVYPVVRRDSPQATGVISHCTPHLSEFILREVNGAVRMCVGQHGGKGWKEPVGNATDVRSTESTYFRFRDLLAWIRRPTRAFCELKYGPVYVECGHRLVQPRESLHEDADEEDDEERVWWRPILTRLMACRQWTHHQTPMPTRFG